MGTREPVVIRSEIDGIPTFSIDGPRPFTAILSFRVGTYDERFPIRGITHLTEHLALYPRRTTEISYNGDVGSHLTDFWAQGHPDQVGDYLRGVCQSLHDLPFDRLDVEADVLQREWHSATHSFIDSILWSYFGPFGPGLSGTYEAGLGWLGPEEIRQWASRYFTRGNAALTIVGKPPESFGIELPEGPPLPFFAPPRTQPAPAKPTLFDIGEQHGVTWGTLIKQRRNADEPAFYIASETLAARLRDRLRHDLGRTYWVQNGWHRIDADLVGAWHGFSADPSQSREVALEHQQVVDEFISNGPTRDELARYVRTRVSRYEDHPDDTARAFLSDLAEAHLNGWEPMASLGWWISQCEALTPDDVRDRFAEAYRQSYTIADLPPGELEPPPGVPVRARPMAGVQFESKLRYRKNQPLAVRIGPDGIDLESSRGWTPSPLGEIAMISFRGSDMSLDATTGTIWIDTSRYVRSRSFWLEHLPSRPTSQLVLVAALLLAVAYSQFWSLVVAGTMVWGLARIRREPDPGEIRDRSLTIEGSVRKYMPEEAILPPPRADGADSGSRRRL